MTYTEQLTRDYAAIRARLYGPVSRPVRIIAMPTVEPEPEPEIGFYVRKRLSIPDNPRPMLRSRVMSIIEMVAAWHMMTVEDLTGPSRQRHHCAARFDAIAAIYTLIKINGRRMSLPEVARYFGGRDHTSILNALRKRGVSCDHA